MRKFVLTAHLTISVGWIGAVLVYLALVFAALNRPDTQVVRAAWLALDWTIQFVIVPLALGSLLTGVLLALGTRWGLFRHYWVLFSLALTTFSVAILLNHAPDVSAFAAAVAAAEDANAASLGGELLHNTGESPAGGSPGGLASELLHAGGGLLVLLVVQTLNVYKPPGLTPYGWRVQQEEKRRFSS